MKGVYPTLSHSILLLLGLISMSLLIVAILSSLSRIEINLTTVELNFVADAVKNKIMGVYSFANQSSSYATGLFQLDLPEKIGNKKYIITLYQNGLTVNATVKNESIEISRTLTIDAELNGSSFMPVSISLEKRNGVIKIGLVK
jgi:hypothetical protein